MANTFNTGVYKEDWEVALQTRLNKPTCWKDVAQVIYSDVQIINNPYMSTEFSLQSGTRGTAFSFSDFALTNSTLTINAQDIVPVYVDRADMAQCSYVGQMDLAERQGALIDERVEAVMLATHGSWTNVGDPGTGIVSGNATQITVSATNIDDIVRAVRRIVIQANGKELARKNGIFFVWRAADFEYLEAFAQANGFELADKALKNGIENAYYFLGAYHYVSNSHTANHVFAGVRKILRIGLLRTTYGKVFVIEDPANGDGQLSGWGIYSRLDYGTEIPAGLSTVLYDVNVV